MSFAFHLFCLSFVYLFLSQSSPFVHNKLPFLFLLLSFFYFYSTSKLPVELGDFSQAITMVNVRANLTNGSIAELHLLFSTKLPQPTVFQLILTYIGVRGNPPHNVQPDVVIGVSPSNFGLSKAIFFSSNSSNTSTLTTCELPNGMEYSILPLEIRLASPSFYQLGEHLMSINGMVGNVEFGIQLQVVVESDTCELLS